MKSLYRLLYHRELYMEIHAKNNEEIFLAAKVFKLKDGIIWFQNGNVKLEVNAN